MSGRKSKIDPHQPIEEEMDDLGDMDT